MSLPVSQITIVDLDENDTYHDLCNDVLMGYQVRLNVNANHPRAPTLAISEFQHQSTSDLISFPPWQPSRSLISLYYRFQSELLYIFPCVPCSHCSVLMLPAQAKWIPRDINAEYDLCQAFPYLSLTEHPTREGYIAICASCTSINKRHNAPRLASIPNALANVPMFHRRWLSPIRLNCSLGRAENTNHFTHYRHLTGAFGLSKNIRALYLYSGTMGAILDSTPNNNWFHPSLLHAANWLKINNRFFRQFDQMFSSIIITRPPNVFPTAQIITDEENISTNNVPLRHQPDIVVPPYDFNPEIHDEDFHYSRLIAGFIVDSNNVDIPISYKDPNLEAILFPDLFPDGHGHWGEISNRLNNRRNRIDTYAKYIKLLLLCPDPRFRLHWYWPYWSYVNLEKLRNHQNRQRILRQRLINRQQLPTIADLINHSIYNNRPVIDETLTTTIPSYIRTGDTYFRQREHSVNAMVQSFGLPQIFYTITMAEGLWPHLLKILSRTDDHCTMPTNRPLHAYFHYHQRLNSVRNLLWKNPKLAEWGKWLHHFERDEFQNRGSIHTHGIAYLDAPIPTLIDRNAIRADLPDPQTEPVLYDLVRTHQIHRCCPNKCGGPPLAGEQCRKKFPAPLSNQTFFNSSCLRYTYRRIKESDRWIVPYHAPTLLLWQGHCNFQYVTSKSFAKYMTKYITKPERSDLFRLTDYDAYRSHIIARRLGAMELMILLTGYSICRSTIATEYLPSTPPNMRLKCVKPVYLLDNENSNPYWADAIDKYFFRPINSCFDNITYPYYHQNYKIKSNQPNTNYWVDQLGKFVIKRKKAILIRFQYLTVEDGEAFFYQQLLLQLPCRYENDLLASYSNYRAHFRARFPERFNQAIQNIGQCATTRFINFSRNYQQQIDRIVNSMNKDIATIVRNQLNTLMHSPSTISRYSILETPTDQYEAFNILTSAWGRSGEHGHPYFFLTGSAGTGKSYLITLIVNHLLSHHKKYLLMAPTGVAAQNIGGKTIHSQLKIRPSPNNHMSLALNNQESRQALLSIEIIIIDEVSMVSASLLTFISNLFARLHNNLLPFGGVRVLLIGDLAQLPPISGAQVFRSPVWAEFYPIFLTTSRRQNQDMMFYQVLNEIRIGNISTRTLQLIRNKIKTPSSRSPIDTTYLVGFRAMADNINQLACLSLPREPDDPEPSITTAIDHIDNQEYDAIENDRNFRQHTNLPATLILQKGARVMYLDNALFEHGLCNGSIGIVTELIDENTANVIFPTPLRMITATIKKITKRFLLNGIPANRHQFPLQNAFALTVHKTQGLTIPNISIAINEQMFAYGQAYVALSRAPSWNSLDITSFDPTYIKTDPAVITEYERLISLHNDGLGNFLRRSP